MFQGAVTSVQCIDDRQDGGAQHPIYFQIKNKRFLNRYNGSSLHPLVLISSKEMNREIYSLKWEFFGSSLSSSLSNAFTDDEYSDVTLISDDKVAFKAHKYVLSACSPVLKNILLNHPHQHPLIFLRGVKQQHLKSILQFMYFGEIKLHHQQMELFMQVARDLKLNIYHLQI